MTRNEKLFLIAMLISAPGVWSRVNSVISAVELVVFGAAAFLFISNWKN
jgi:hypothetical protein